MIITIDGPAGSGKSTVAANLAERLGYRFLDTGAMYRVVGWNCLKLNIDFDDKESIVDLARRNEITFSDGHVFSDSNDVTEAIRSSEVTHAASVVAQNTGVRQAMVDLQRRMAAGQNLVTEGRDQGTVVFPDADWKFFITADPAERAKRRQSELLAKGIEINHDDVLAQIYERDQRDATRLVAPLRAAEDAIEIDTTRMTADEVLDQLVRTIQGQ